MKLLITAATATEIQPLIDWMAGFEKDDPIRDRIKIWITGVGLMAATYELTRALASQPFDCVIGAGIAGAFDKSLALGECVIIKSEQLADLGAEDGNEFLDLFSLGLMGDDEALYANKKLVNPLQRIPFPIEHLRQKDGLTVLTTSGNERTIAQRTERYGAEVESMEGAALHYVCARLGMTYIQLRAISNYVTRRDRSSWKIREAVTALNAQLLQWLK